jgi:hypothetical protein
LGSTYKLSGGADKRWDFSRRYRLRIKSATVDTEDHDSRSGGLFGGLPSPDRIQEDFPVDEAEGNDDPVTVFQDNDPYSDKEVQPKKTTFTPKGKLGYADFPVAPVFRDSAGDNNNTYELHYHFGEFVRLQIGNSNAVGQRNWFRISDYKDWRHVAKLKKVNESWVNNGSLAEPNNDGW